MKLGNTSFCGVPAFQQPTEQLFFSQTVKVLSLSTIKMAENNADKSESDP